MRRQVYRFFATLVMMLLYLSVTVASDVVSLTCRCKCNHSADVHTAFAHPTLVIVTMSVLIFTRTVRVVSLK